MIDAARLKARTTLALADCFAATTAAAHRLVLLTGDPELLDLNDPPCRLEDLRAKQTPQH
jgi:predicted nucleic acid-binding protein